MKNKKTLILVSGTLLCGSLFAANAEASKGSMITEEFALTFSPAYYHQKTLPVEPAYGNVTGSNEPFAEHIYDNIQNSPDLPVEPHYDVPRTRPVEPIYDVLHNTQPQPVELAYMPMVAVRHTITTGSLKESGYAEIDDYTVKITETPLKEKIPPAFKKKNSFFPFSLFSFIQGAFSPKRENKRWSLPEPSSNQKNIYAPDPTETLPHRASLPSVLLPLPVKKEKVKRTFSLRSLLRLSGKSSEKPALIRRASAPELSFSVKASPSLPPFPQRSLPPLPHSPEALEEFFQGTFVKTSDEDGYEVPTRSLPRNTQEQRQNEKDLILFDDQQMTEEPIYLNVLADQESDYQTLPEISLLDDAIDPAILAALPTPLSPSSK